MNSSELIELIELRAHKEGRSLNAIERAAIVDLRAAAISSASAKERLPVYESKLARARAIPGNRFAITQYRQATRVFKAALLFEEKWVSLICEKLKIDEKG